MIDLDDEGRIKDLDRSNLSSSIKQLPDQVQQVWEEAKNFPFPESYAEIKNVVVSGMGGSALGARIIQSFYSDQLKVPLTIVNNYDLPEFVSEETLVVLSSYSGTTQETLSTFSSARLKEAKIVGLSTGGELAKLLEKAGYPVFVFEPRHNPCNQPRMGVGYSVFAQLGLFKQAGLIKLSDQEVVEVIKLLKEANLVFGLESPLKNNLAKQTAQKLFDRGVVLVGSGFLAGNTHTFQNQLHENAKTFTTYFLVPELNHHLMEGLARPAKIKESLSFLFLISDFYPEIVKIRFEITKEVVSRHGFEVLEYQPKAASKLLQAFETLVFGSWVSFYLAMINGLDPSPILWVDYFKKRLAEAG
jgi:glucose/mannose-6-phosphate isomerase